MTYVPSIASYPKFRMSIKNWVLSCPMYWAILLGLVYHFSALRRSFYFSFSVLLLMHFGLLPPKSELVLTSCLRIYFRRKKPQLTKTFLLIKFQLHIFWRLSLGLVVIVDVVDVDDVDIVDDAKSRQALFFAPFQFSLSFFLGKLFVVNRCRWGNLDGFELELSP